MTDFVLLSYYQIIHLYFLSVNNRSRAFTLSGNSNTPVNSMVGSGAGANVCANDWLLVPCAANVGRLSPAQALCTDRICGGTFSADLSMQSSSVLSKYYLLLCFKVLSI